MGSESRLDSTALFSETSEHCYTHYLTRLVSDGTRWLDLGCGRELIRDWMPNAVGLQSSWKAKCSKLYGIDAVEEDVNANPFLQRGFVGDIRNLPFDDSTFDLLTAHMVVEHIEDPLPFLCEWYRVLAPNGRLLLITPNLAHYLVFGASILPRRARSVIARLTDERQENDIFPTYYRLNTMAQVRRYAIKCGFFIDLLGAVDTLLCLRRFPVLRNIESALNRVSPGINLIACLRKP